jgi:hypothetical protein
MVLAGAGRAKLAAANQWCALKTALIWNSSDSREKADNIQNTCKICM